jgi:hypothetical protein
VQGERERRSRRAEWKLWRCRWFQGWIWKGRSRAGRHGAAEDQGLQQDLSFNSAQTAKSTLLTQQKNRMASFMVSSREWVMMPVATDSFDSTDDVRR